MERYVIFFSIHDCFKKVLLKIFLYKFEVDEHLSKIFKLEIAPFFPPFFFLAFINNAVSQIEVLSVRKLFSLKTNEPFEFEPKHLHRNALWIDSKLTSNITCQEAKAKTSFFRN